MNRKTIFILASAALLLFGCGKKDPKIYGVDGPVADGDVMIESSTSDAKTLNPILLSEMTGADIDNLVFDGLFRLNEKFEMEPALALKWEISKDGKTITYHLRKGVKFHDGVEFTADDVVFNWKAYVDPKTNTPQGTTYRDITSAKALDKYTVRITYGKPYAPALMNFSLVAPKHLLEGQDINKADFNRAPVGTGPYKFVEWKTDQRIVLEANPDYWGGKPHIKRFVMKIIPDQSSEFLSLLKGEIDTIGAWMSGGITSEEYTRQCDQPKFKNYYDKFKADSLSYSYIGWNGARPMFSDKLVRQALTMAIDRQSIIENVSYGLGRICTGPFAASSWAYDPQVKPWPYDPARAKKQLEKAGWKDTDGDGILDKDLKGDGKREPFKFTLLIPQGGVSAQRIGTIVQQQFQKIGVQMDIKILEWTTFLSQNIEKHDFDAMIMGWGLTPDPDNYQIWHSSQRGPHLFNRVDYHNAEVDRLLEAGVRTLDQKKRQAIYRRIHVLIAEDQPYTFLTQGYTLPVIHKRFKGYKQIPLWDPSLVRFQEWYVPASQQIRAQQP